jgi:lysophospholipase L1-like esterase
MREAVIGRRRDVQTQRLQAPGLQALRLRAGGLQALRLRARGLQVRCRRARRLCAAAALALTALVAGCTTSLPPEQAGAWTVVGLGDSVPSGHGCHCRELVGGYADLAAAATGRPVRSVNLGRDGSTSSDLLDDLTGDPGVRRAVAGADVVLLITGANDLQPQLDEWGAGRCGRLDCFDRELPKVRQRLAAVLATVSALRAGRPTEVLVATYWNVFVDGAAARRHGPQYVAMSRTVTRRVAAAECSAAAEARVRCVDLAPLFTGPAGDRDPTPLLQADGDHPNQAGHAAIARALAAKGWPRLAR